MNLRIAICDDEQEQQNITKQMLTRYSIHKDLELQITLFSNGEDLLEAITDSQTFHMILLDVEMEGISGVETAKKIREQYGYQIHIIFISMYPKYMQSGFDVRAFHYLIKPVKFEYLESILDRLIDEIENGTTKQILLHKNDMDYLIGIHDILYFEVTKSKRRIILAHTKDSEIYERTGYLSDVESELEGSHFISPCRGYLVNLCRIKAIQKQQVFLENGEAIPLSKRREKEIKNRFAKHVISIS